MKNKINFFIAAAMLTSVLLIGLVASILEYVLPPGSGRPYGAGGGGSQTFLWMQRHDWGEIHGTLGAIFLILLAIHLALHWKWILCQYRAIFNKASVDKSCVTKE